ncbi:tRNA pseudouridine(13) synthase TruD [Candidatus Harpocratesius sp.]
MAFSPTVNGNIYDQMRRFVGIRGFTTDTPPIGGRIKEDIADFIVQEILPNGEVLTTRESFSQDLTFTTSCKFTQFTVIKKNTDTIYAAEVIRDFLHVSEYDIQWAGIKDHTAITSQRFSVRGDFIEKLYHFRHPNIDICQIAPSRHYVKLGRLWGNRFTINIRHTERPFSEIEPIITKWTDQINERGFPNYYGMQRFGQHRPNSHLVGRYLFCHQYKEAVEEFLFTIYPLEYEKIREARKKLAENAQNGIWSDDLPRSLHYEKRMVQYLNHHSNDYKGAILSLPPSLINLILSSYQSYLFNLAVSERLERNNFLHKPVNGDIVSILKDPKGHPSLIFYKYHGGDGWNDPNIIKAFKHHRAAVVAPIIGYKTDLEKFSYFKPIFSSLLEKHEFPLDFFDHKFPKLFLFEGTFRAINNFPTNLKVQQAYILNKYPELDPNGVKLEFSLPKGTYATMLLAELRKHFIDLE